MMRRLAPLLALTGCFIAPPRPGSGGDDDDASGNQGTPNKIFVTSTLQPVGAFGSIEAADALCRSLATAQSLSGTYIAWLSSSTMSAKLRLGSARGWVRVDGLPFADTVDDLIAGRIWYPPRLDELGVDHVVDTDLVATGTRADGSLDVAGNCSDFTNTSTATDLVTGAPGGGTGSWTAHGTAHCGTPTRLYCLGIDRNAVVAPPPKPTGRIAFVGVQPRSPASGVQSMDSGCDGEASGQGLPGVFKALVATTMASAASRFTIGDPWFRPDGVKITDDLIHLDAPIDVNAAGQYTPFTIANEPWTGAVDVQTPATASPTSNCGDWSSFAATMSGKVGDLSVAADPAWFNNRIGAACSLSRPVYCLQQ